MNFPEVFPELVPEGFKGTWIEGLPEENYHADRSAVSSTAVRHFQRSPAHFWSRFVLGYEKEKTEAVKFGTLAHKAILEPSSLRDNYLVVPDFGNCTYKENKLSRDAWLAEHGLVWVPRHGIKSGDGSEPTVVLIKEEEAQHIEGMVKAIIAHPKARALLSDGVAEVSGVFREPTTGLKCRIRPDFLSHSLKALVDYKTTIDASFRRFHRDAYERGYQVQLGMYEEGVNQICGWRPEQTAVIAQEKEPPYAVSVFVCDEGFLSRGQSDFRTACAGIKQCLEEGRWPAYSEELQTLCLPAYADAEATL